MRHYYKRSWDESTGEELTDTWGTSIYYFETDEQLNVLRQIQVFEKGQVLKYFTENSDDEFGMLSDQKLDNDEFEEFTITELEFNTTWDNSDKKTIWQTNYQTSTQHQTIFIIEDESHGELQKGEFKTFGDAFSELEKRAKNFLE